jgi:regulator of protease activity HflC (stomatin/prohibitin superfamily)
VVLPTELTKIVSDKQIAEQEKITYKTQTEAADEKKKLANMEAQAAMQPEVVKSERGVEISKNIANGEVEKATGAAKAVEIRATGDAKALKLSSEAAAEATKVTAGAEAEKISKTGNAEAEKTLAIGKATAEAYKLSVEAMGPAYGQLKIVEQIAQHNLKLIPDVFIGGGGQNGGSNLDNMMGIMLMEKLTQTKETPKAEEKKQ